MIPVINSVFSVLCSSVFGLFGPVFGHDQIDQNIGCKKGNRCPGLGKWKTIDWSLMHERIYSTLGWDTQLLSLETRWYA